MNIRTIGVITVARSDSGIYLPVLQAIKNHPKLQLKLIVAAMHLSNEFGLTYKYLQEQGFEIDERVEMTMSSDTPEGLAKSIGLGMISFGQLFGKWKPDILMVLGDRFEMLAAVCAAMPFTIPIAHLHGGEATEGLIDEPIRHSITKMSHLHFVSTKEYYNRVTQLGEEPWRVTISGAPSLDLLNKIKFWSKDKLESKIGLSLKKPTILVTLHPVTLDYQNTLKHINCLLKALEKLKIQVVFTYPNADTCGRIIIEKIRMFVGRFEWASAVVNFGQEGYFTMLNYASAMVGNSSSGIIESASFGIPVINIGHRQRGRVRSFNIIDIGYNQKEIFESVKKVIKPDFRKKLEGMKSPYGDGTASQQIVDVISKVQINQNLIMKKFYNLDAK
jgi:GDP/UDP-N,N'-diacetylbacillosamine 2-epimerase (hydrolysing)